MGLLGVRATEDMEKLSVFGRKRPEGNTHKWCQKVWRGLRIQMSYCFLHILCHVIASCSLFPSPFLPSPGLSSPFPRIPALYHFQSKNPSVKNTAFIYFYLFYVIVCQRVCVCVCPTMCVPHCQTWWQAPFLSGPTFQ